MIIHCINLKYLMLTVTIINLQLFESNAVSPKSERSLEDKTTTAGVFYMHLSYSYSKYDVDLLGIMPRRMSFVGAMKMDGYSTHDVFVFLITALGTLAPFLLYTKGGQLIKRLQQSSSKAKLPFFWAVASLAHVFNVYLLGKLLLITCYHYYESSPLSCRNSCLVIGYNTIVVVIISCIHSKYITLPIPKTWSIFSKCCGRQQHRIVATISLLGIYLSAVSIIAFLPVQLLLVSANPHLYGFGILTVWCAMFVCIIITSIPFTIDQIFIKEEEYRITPKQALRQILLLMFIAVLVFGFGSLTFSVTLVLHLSKYGEKTQSVSKSIYFVIQHVAIPIVLWMVKRMLQKIKQSRVLWRIIQK